MQKDTIIVRDTIVKIIEYLANKYGNGKHTNKIFAKEKDKLITEFTKEFESELNLMKGESARLFAISCTGIHPNTLKNKFYWWLQCINHYQRGGKGKAVAFSTKKTLESIKEIFDKGKEIECKKLILENEQDLDERFYNIIENIPDELHDSKVEIKKLFDKLML